MTVSLGGIILDENLILTGDTSSSQLAMSIRATFGATVVQRSPRTGGKALTLSANKSGGMLFGSFTYLQEKQIAAIRDLGEPVTLVHPTGSWTVIITPTGLNLSSSFDNISDPLDSDLRSGTVTMKTI